MKVIATAFCLCLLGKPALAQPPRDDAAALIRAYNSRDIGAPGWRRVSLELKTKGMITRKLVVSNAWVTSPQGVRTLFMLEAPEGMRGICYLLAESLGATPFMRIHLFMPVGAKKVLEVATALEEQGLLGSDFTYRDLTWRLPEMGYQARIVGDGTLSGHTVTFLEYSATKPGDTWPRRKFAISRSSLLVLGIDFYRDGASVPDKTYRVESFERRGQVWTPTRITVTQGDSVSVLLLEQGAFGIAPPSESLLKPEGLAATAMLVRDGATMERFVGVGK